MTHRLPNPARDVASSGSGWRVRTAPLAQLAEIAPLALASATEQRKRLVLSLLADLLRRSASRDLFLAEAYEEERRVAAAIAIRTAEDSASLMAVDAEASDRVELQRHLLRHLHRGLADAGVTFVQAMREPEVAQPVLLACGYEFLATLDYLVAACRAPVTAARGLRWVPFEAYFSDAPLEARSPTSRAGLIALIDATYSGSLDCPAMERFRSAATMVDGSRQSPDYDPEGWQILSDEEDCPLGCLLSTAHRAAGSLEITYMGLVPAARGRGLSGAILDQAWRIADRSGLPQLTVAVDRANLPAIKLYQRHGFEALASETVWGRAVELGEEISR